MEDALPANPAGSVLVMILDVKILSGIWISMMALIFPVMCRERGTWLTRS
jgi:hypothetical protein